MAYQYNNPAVGGGGRARAPTAQPAAPNYSKPPTQAPASSSGALPGMGSSGGGGGAPRAPLPQGQPAGQNWMRDLVGQPAPAPIREDTSRMYPMPAPQPPMQGQPSQSFDMRNGIPYGQKGNPQNIVGNHQPPQQPRADMVGSIYNNPKLSREQQQQAIAQMNQRFGGGGGGGGYNMQPAMPQRPPYGSNRFNPYGTPDNRGAPIASRANLSGNQMNTWQQRMSGGMRGNPGQQRMEYGGGPQAIQAQANPTMANLGQSAQSWRGRMGNY